MTAEVGRPVGWSTAEVVAILGPWIDAGVVGEFEVQLVRAVLRQLPAPPADSGLLGLALVARATRLGHVCLDLRRAHEQVVAALDDTGGGAVPGLPDADVWRTDLGSSPLVQLPGDVGADDLVRPLVLDGHRLYLHRLWRFEVDVAAQFGQRWSTASAVRSAPSEDAVDAVLGGLFSGGPTEEDGAPDLQFVAARRALTRPVTVIGGGPGTGKTHTVARLLAAALELGARQGEVLRVALVAPTGKAAARMQEAVESQVVALLAAGRIDADRAADLRGIVPTTIHRLLGGRPRTGVRHDRNDPLVHDLVVVDETSMVSLPLLARLLDAVRPGARLVLVGDPFQLASIEAGTVLADMVGPGGASEESAEVPLGGRVTELRRGHRFDHGSAIAELALAVRDGLADQVVERLSAGGPVRWIRPDQPEALAALRAQVADAAVEVVGAALADDGPAALAAATRIKVLAAVRHGPLGLVEWTESMEDVVLRAIPAALRGGVPRVGTPVMVTRNDPVNRLANGDVGVVVLGADARWVALAGTSDPRRLAPARLGTWEPWWAMTIHKSQGSEFPHAVVSLPPADSPILTRELLYTAVTRARDEVTVIGTEETIRQAVDRPVTRASGLRDRLWPPG